MRKFILGAALTAAVAATPGHAALVVDQSFVADPVTLNAVFDTRPGAFRRVQTFTAGVTGVLEQVRVQLAQPTTFQGLSVYATANGRPTQQVLAAATYNSTADGFAIFDVALAITAGQVLAIDPYTSSVQQSVGWAGSNADRYAGGASFYSIDSGASYGSEGFDQGFQTLVRTADAGAVPEPATWATMILGMAAAGAVLRRRRVRFSARAAAA